jgi:hypothetical protein
LIKKVNVIINPIYGKLITLIIQLSRISILIKQDVDNGYLKNEPVCGSPLNEMI